LPAAGAADPLRRASPHADDDAAVRMLSPPPTALEQLSVGGDRAAPAGALPLLELLAIRRDYHLPREAIWQRAPVVHALAGVSLALHTGRNLGVVGESGSGKSTLARIAMALEPPTSGQVNFLGRNLNQLGATELRHARRDFQMVFQDPYGSLDPRQRIGAIVAEPLFDASAAQRSERVAAMLDAVGLRASDADKYPHEFSGGQRQRIAIARALITKPKLIVADEPVSALDVSVQAQVLNLLQDLQDQFGVTYLLISHDLAVVDHVCDEVIVMYAGQVVEQGASSVLFRAAAHPYTRALLAAAMQTRVGAGAPQARTAAAPSSRVAVELDAAAGCPFAPRCGYRQARCASEAPNLRTLAPGHQAACHVAEQVMMQTQSEGDDS
jgi:peptide/nickel transport system ATP-binding protein